MFGLVLVYRDLERFGLWRILKHILTGKKVNHPEFSILFLVFFKEFSIMFCLSGYKELYSFYIFNLVAFNSKVQSCKPRNKKQLLFFRVIMDHRWTMRTSKRRIRSSLFIYEVGTSGFTFLLYHNYYYYYYYSIFWSIFWYIFVCVIVFDFFSIFILLFFILFFFYFSTCWSLYR